MTMRVAGAGRGIVDSELGEVERLDSKLPSLLELAECTESAGKLLGAAGEF